MVGIGPLAPCEWCGREVRTWFEKLIGQHLDADLGRRGGHGGSLQQGIQAGGVAVATAPGQGVAGVRRTIGGPAHGCAA